MANSVRNDMPEMTVCATLNLPQSMTFENASACSQALAKALLAQEEVEGVAVHVAVDASAVGVFDSSALAVLLQCRRDAVQAHKTFEVIGMPPQLQELSKLYGVDQLLLNV